jgi:RimJ/RimL family protein N-acetyltransferase
LNSADSDIASVLAAPSSEWNVTARAKNHTPVCIRPLRVDDREREIEFINALSEESRYFRLFTPLKFLSRHLVDQLMSVDGERRMAFVATIETDKRERLIGIARYGETENPRTGELGITVADNWHRQGIATQLIQHLCRYARSRGFTRLTGLVLSQNVGMLALAHRIGFTSRHAEDDLIRIELDLTKRDA